MKMKKGLLLVVLLLALSSVMAAMSYTKASVSNDMSFNIENTNSSLLALKESKQHNASFYNTAGADKLKIDLDKGFGDSDFGIQNNSTYSWDKLFTVKNNSEHAVNVSIETNPKVDTKGQTQGINTYLSSLEDSWTQINGMYGAGAGEYTFTLEPNEERQINLKLESMHGSNKHQEERNFDIIVNAESVMPQ
ncbi:hypothetical protein [Virgibacillus doumboii]|uniref:hypothetical protein n=1 Tax=Virgibacillus doumboii TaxID=2697503 RepID=UPI0013DFB878|nr:hypothetical protein [Virgibacillus doumboii]